MEPTTNAHTHLDLTAIGPVPFDPELTFDKWATTALAGRPTEPGTERALVSDNVFTLEAQPRRLLVVGGSLGAKPLNDLVPGVVRKLLKSAEGAGLEVWHQSGAAHGDAVRDA